MAVNGKILAKANAALADIKENNLLEHERRISEVNQKVPEIAEISQKLRLQMTALAKLIFADGAEDAISKLKEENLSLQIRKAELLVENGFPRDYLDDIYSCPVCKDTGHTGSGMCSCLRKLYNDALTRDLSTLFRNGDECFESFDLNLYPTEHREHMQSVYDLAREYAQYFPEVENLLLMGAPGLGKTFVSGCIAREVASKGYSVYYASASEIFADFEAAQFKGDEQAASRVSSLYDCDLLILDDLGTELRTPSVVSSLYSIINNRINTSKCMIMNTNMSKNDVLEHYSAAIGSRINGYFTELEFFGDDIRKKSCSQDIQQV